MPAASPALAAFHAPTRAWFASAFGAPTPPQAQGWPPIARRESALLLAPTGTGKTLAAFLACIDRLMFEPVPPRKERCRVVYVSPLKALAVDVERNLRVPLAGIRDAAAKSGTPHHVPEVAIRTGDTPQKERARFGREPADVLITTPESLYLLLTSQAREVLRAVDTVIVDEIHALVPTKRGAHLALSLERLEELTGRPLQRIGLSATQRPLDEVARFLGGALPRAKARAAPKRPRRKAAGEVAGTLAHEFAAGGDAPAYRPVTVVDASAKKPLAISIEVPVEDLARLGERRDGPEAAPARASIWTAIHPRLVELVRAHTSTLVFVNSRRVAERLAGALNDLAGETLALAHHGSIAKDQRLDIEERLKAGRVRCLVATSSLELGIDMGAIDLVVQIEAPPSVASGLQRIGRAAHQVGATSKGVVFPKYRGDLVACAAVVRAMHEGRVEATRYPRNPLDVLAQQIVAMVAMEPWGEGELFRAVRRAAPFAELSRPIFDGVLDMLAGRYPSDEFAELRPRITWDRAKGTLTAREGAKKVAVVNGGTIPDRGLYGVFLAGAPPGSARVGELDEEMVFETKVGETFVLGASTWRVDEITHDKVLVSPAPGQPGKLPFWRGDAAGRPLELGRAIGALVRELGDTPRAAALDRLVKRHGLERQAAENLLAYLEEQRAATGAVPDDRTIVVERTRDELGDFRICVLSPFGGQIHAPWAMAATAKIRDELGLEVETTWTDDGFVVRFPERDEPPDAALLIPGADEVERLLLGQLGGTALFAGRFREIAARALLLPRRRPGARTPLWQQRKRASDLLAVASRFGSFPMLLEAHRELLRDVFDLPSLQETLRDVAAGRVRVEVRDPQTPSPFASAILFGFVANYLYDGDAPLAERRAQALAIDQAQLRELLGEAELRELLDPAAIEETERRLQRLDERARARSADGVHDLLLSIGELSRAELAARCETPAVATSVDELVRAGRVLELQVAGAPRFAAVEDAARFRDAASVPLPPGLPGALLQPVRDPAGDLVLRYARTHGPFTADEVAARLGIPRARVDEALARHVATGRLLEGAFRPGGVHREHCEADVLRQIRRRSLARLRHEVEPVEPRVLARLHAAWQGASRPRRGLDALLDAVERLQGVPIAASILERDVLPARVAGYLPGDLDALAAAGEVVWSGVEPGGERDGKLALYLADHAALLRVAPDPSALALEAREEALVAHLRRAGASFFPELHQAAGGGFPAATVDALWSLVFRGVVTNDTFAPLRAFVRRPEGRGRRRERATGRAFRSRRTTPPEGEGRWSLVARGAARAGTEIATAIAQQLLTRYGVVTREVAQAEAIPGGFSAIYPVLKRLEETGRVRRGYFVAGVGAAQFAVPAALDQLRALRDDRERPEALLLAAADPASPYGAALRWPAPRGGELRPGRAAGAHVVLVDGALAAWLGRGGRQLLTWLPEDEPERGKVAKAVASRLAALAERRREGLLVAELDGGDPTAHPLARHLADAGFLPSAHGYYLRRVPAAPPADDGGDGLDDDAFWEEQPAGG